MGYLERVVHFGISSKRSEVEPCESTEQVKQGKDSLRDYIARIKYLNARCEPHERLSDEQLLPRFLLGLRSSKLHDQLIVLNITSFETCSKKAIRLGDNMREGDETITTSIPSILGSKDSDASSS